MKPLVSYRHTLQEISVNRDDPCEVIRELVSNSYDADASEIRIFTLPATKTIVFFDNGVGLSDRLAVNGVYPYQAFFSIGCSTKQKGAATVGYKCQGSKLCFASEDFALITRCDGDRTWRWKQLLSPWKKLSENTDISAEETSEPWRILRDEIFTTQSEELGLLVEQLDEKFFRETFSHGTLLCIQGFRDDRFAEHFGAAEDPSRNKFSYLREYIRLYTSHGDVRKIENVDYAFSRSDINAVTSLNSRRDTTCKLRVWVHGSGKGHFDDITPGWPYLKGPMGTSQPDSPTQVSQLNKGRFFSRNATTFEYEGRKYGAILAIDGHRKALDQYDSLDRQGRYGRRSGIRLSEQRGVFLASSGIRVCSYNDLLAHPGLDEWSVLAGGTSHFCLMINGWFDLVTNRNGLSAESKAVLNSPGFVDNIKRFLDDIGRNPDSTLALLKKRLNREHTEETLEHALEQQNARRASLRERDRFIVAELGNRLIPFPIAGEEHYIGALYTLFSHIVKPSDPLKPHWPRAISFAGIGIDAMVTLDEQAPFDDRNVKFAEYKYSLDISDEYNHPLEYTSAIICWDMSTIPSPGATLSDPWEATSKVVQSLMKSDGTVFGVLLGDVVYPSGKIITTQIPVICLKRLLGCTFNVTWMQGAPRTKKKP